MLTCCGNLHMIWDDEIRCAYGVATISRMLKNIGLFCKRALQKRPVFCKETCIFKHPTHRSHPISYPSDTFNEIRYSYDMLQFLIWYHMNISWQFLISYQHTATHCNTLQHTATHCNTLQHTATHCNTLQHTATHCNILHCHMIWDHDGQQPMLEWGGYGQ